MSKAAAGSFDKAYVDAQVSAHNEAIPLFRAYAKSGEGELKSFAERTLPVIEGHNNDLKGLTKGPEKSVRGR